VPRHGGSDHGKAEASGTGERGVPNPRGDPDEEDEDDPAQGGPDQGHQIQVGAAVATGGASAEGGGPTEVHPPPRRGDATGIRAGIVRRLREIRQELFGERGGPELARRLNLPARTWYNYETGVSLPAEVLLAFIEQTGANPWWVLTGAGSKYRRSDEP
jgi:hypothetical protein